MNELVYQLLSNSQGGILVFMPISRLVTECPRIIGDLRVFPRTFIELREFRPVPNRSLSEINDVGAGALPHREVATALTGFDVRVLNTATLVAFTVDLDWRAFLNASHYDDVELIRRLSRTAERVFDVVRFQLCRFDLPETLPGVIGSWENSGPYMGAMLYTPANHESYLIAGEAIESNIVGKGIGLELEDISVPIPSAAEGDVAANAIHALSLYSDAMLAGTDTLKFGRIMTLIEFLASPGEFRTWKKLKSDILCHCACSKHEYHELARRFRELTSLKDEDGVERGLRTLIVHHGKFLEELVPSSGERRALFHELQVYCCHVIQDMLKNPTLSWSEFESLRSTLKSALRV